jgi:predicted nucleic acid-binding protein
MCAYWMRFVVCNEYFVFCLRNIIHDTRSHISKVKLNCLFVFQRIRDPNDCMMVIVWR